MCVVYLIGEFAVNVQIRFSPVCRLPFVQDVEYGNTTHLGDCDGEFVNLFGMWPLASRSTFSASLLPRENSLANSSTIQKRSSLVWFESLLKQSKSRESHRLHRERWMKIMREKQSLESFLFRNELISLKYEVAWVRVSDCVYMLKRQKMVYIFKQWEA